MGRSGQGFKDGSTDLGGRNQAAWTEPIHRLIVAISGGCGGAGLERLVKALAWHGKGDVRWETVPDSRIEHPRDAVIKVTACAICGSDLHIYGGIIASMKKGDVLGHENMGEVVEVGGAAVPESALNN